MDGYIDKDGPAVHVLYEPIWNGLVSLKEKGIRIRGITEVTSDNIDYCKKLMEVGELCHLEGVSLFSLPSLVDNISIISSSVAPKRE